MLELDHLFCLVAEPAEAARRLEEHGWVLDAGRAHPGQGTRNRRLVWPEQYFELLWITSAAEELGGIDLLFSNAGAMALGGDPASWEQNFRLDVLGAVNAFDAARPFLEKGAAKSGDAAFVIVSSVSAAQADNASAYGPVKAALVHMAKGLARQYAAKKIRVNVVSPGTVYFPGGVWHTREQNAPEYFKQMLARNPTGRMATPQEIANAAVFLGSPASSFTTGSNLIVDGAISNRVNF